MLEDFTLLMERNTFQKNMHSQMIQSGGLQSNEVVTPIGKENNSRPDSSALTVHSSLPSIVISFVVSGLV